MNRTILLAASAAAVLSVAACSKPASTTAADTGQAASNAASSAAQTASAAAGKAEDAVGAAVGATSAATVGSHDTGAFVSNASQSDMFEIDAAKMAEARSKNPEVKAFAKKMVTAHTAMMNAMKPLVIAAGQKPADKLDDRRQGFLDNLKAASAADFDKTYIDQQVAAHEEALDLMKGYAKDGSDAGLKGGAEKAIPMVQEHLDKAKAIQATLKKA